MTYNVFTATDQVDALDQLIEVLTSRHLASIDSITAAGTGYEVNEILDLDGSGTFTHAAQIEVVTVGGSGDITSARIYRGGAYTVDPDTTATATVTTDTLADGTAVATANGTGATFNLTMAATGWSQLTRESIASSAVVAAGGTGYTNGSTDVLTVVGGVLAPGGTAATFTATVSGGIVTSAALLSAGDYEVVPSNPTLTTVAPSGGTGATLTVTWADKTGDTRVVLQGDAGAATDPLVGIITYNVPNGDETGLNTIYNWGLFGMSSWSSQFAMHEQANVTPGFNALGDGTITAIDGEGAWVPLKTTGGVNMICTVRATGRSVIFTARVEGASTVYSSQCAFGLTNQFGLTSEYPFPAFVCGTSSRKNVWFRDTASIFGGLTDVLQLTDGPLYIFHPNGTWIEAKVSLISGVQDTTPSYAVQSDGDRATVFPLGATSPRSGDDLIVGSAGTDGFDQDDLTLATGATQIYRTPDTGGDLFPLFPVEYTQHNSATDDYLSLGRVDGLWWLGDNDAGLGEGDRIEQAGVAYTIHQNGTQVQPHSFLAVEES